MYNRLSRLSSPSDKKHASQAVFKELSSYFFDKIKFISHSFSEMVTSTDYTLLKDGGGTVVFTKETDTVTDTTSFNGTSRITDTAEGMFLTPEKVSRMRCHFYLLNPDALIGYLLCPVIYDSFSSLNTISAMTIFRAYVGLKFNQGDISVAVKESGKSEVTYSTGLSFSGSGATDTYTLEIRYYVTYTEIYINGDYIGSYTTDFGLSNTNMSYLPLLAPGKSSDGSGVNITVENYQFIQDN